MATLASEGRPPELNKVKVSFLVRKYFNFVTISEDSVKALPGYDDRNYYFEGTITSEKNGPFIFKLFNTNHTAVSEIEGCYQIIRHLQRLGVILQVPEKSKTGGDIALITAKEMKEVRKNLQNVTMNSYPLNI